MMRNVRLELARCIEFPDGSSAHGYELRVPLGRDGKLERDEWHKHRGESGFRRFWGGDDEYGEIKHGHRGWVLSFKPGTEDDEVIFKGDEHRFIAGEYVSVKERDGLTRTFHVAGVH